MTDSSNESRSSLTLTENPLESTTSRIQEQASRFRLLVLGKSGVGKSTLINRTFGLTDDSMISHDCSGQHDINTEIYPPTNDLLVVHDSQGYEAGEKKNLQIVEDFIMDRATRKDPSERLHCAWLCIQTPTSGGRVLEAGTEKVLRQLSQFRVPLVVVFTQYDRLFDDTWADVYDAMPDATDEERDAEAWKRTKQILDNDVKPQIEDFLDREAIEGQIIAVSSMYLDPDQPSQLVAEYKGQLQELVRKSVLVIRQVPDNQRQPAEVPTAGVNSEPCRFGTADSGITTLREETSDLDDFDPSICMAMAQRVDPKSKIEAIIKIGRKRYWRSLASSAYFSRRKLRQCLHVLHADVLGPWNFYPLDKEFLASETFEALISQVVGGSGDPSQERPAKWRDLVATPGAVAGIIAGSVAVALPTGPAAPAVGPAVFVGLIFAKWVYDTYQKTPETLRHIMEYIIHLTNVLLIVHELTSIIPDPSSGSDPIKGRAADAFDLYNNSQAKVDVHSRVKNFVVSKKWRVLDRDYAFGEVEEILLSSFEKLHNAETN